MALLGLGDETSSGVDIVTRRLPAGPTLGAPSAQEEGGLVEEE